MTSVDAGTDPAGVSVSPRRVGGGLLLISLLALLSHGLPQDHPVWAAVKVVSAALTVGVVPGALVVLAVQPCAGLTLLEVFGIGVAVSLGWIQLATVISLTLHIPVSTMAMAWAGAAAAAAAVLAIRKPRDPRWTVRLDTREAVIGGSLLTLAVLLYLKGAPFLTWDDQVHAALVRRLAYVRHPALDNLHFLPNLVFTYPFPGTHFLMALVSQLGGIDALFVFHKLRFLWGVAALTFLYLIARRVFEDLRLAFVVAVTAILFVLNGSFGDGPDLDWGQLAPHSNPADVALSVLLPALLVMALYFLGAEGGRTSAFFLVGGFAVAAMVAMVQIRSVVQFLVYFGCFLVGALLFGRDRRYLARSALLIGGTVGVVTVYLLFYQLTVPHISAAVDVHRAAMLAAARSFSLAQWLSPPLELVPGFDSLFWSWHPFMLIASPLLLLVFRKKPLMLLVGASIFVYLLLIRVPALTLLYAYATHFEILSWPVRNVGIFTYLLTGACLYVIAANLARIRRRAVSLGAAAGIALVGALTWSRGTTVFVAQRDLFFLPVVLMYGIALVGLRSPERATSGARVEAETVSPSWKAPFILLLGLLTLLTPIPKSSPLALGALHDGIAAFAYSTNVPLTPKALLTGLRCVGAAGADLPLLPVAGSPKSLKARYPSCPPSAGLVRWSETALGEDALVLADATDLYALSVFIPQHVLTGLPWRSLPISWGGEYVRGLFPAYFRAFDLAMREHGTQPFFNERQSPEEKAAFLRTVGITHIFVHAAQSAVVAPLALGRADLLRKLYDDGEWAVYEVVARSARVTVRRG